MENVGLMVNAQVSVWLSKYGIYSSSPELIDELELQFAFATYAELVRRVRTGMYNRKYSLYLNIRSCAYSQYPKVYKQWKRRMQQLAQLVSLEYGSVDSDGDITEGLIGSIASDTVPRLRTGSDSKDRIVELDRARKGRSKRYKSNEGRKCYTMDNLPNHIEDSWLTYIEDCEELGIPVRMSKEEYVKQHYGNLVRIKGEKTLNEEMVAEERKAADTVKERLRNMMTL